MLYRQFVANNFFVYNLKCEYEIKSKLVDELHHSTQTSCCNKNNDPDAGPGREREGNERADDLAKELSSRPEPLLRPFSGLSSSIAEAEP